MEEVGRQMRLNGEPLRQELLVEVLSCLLAHQDAPTVLVFERTARLTHHLQDVHHRVVDVPVLLALVELHTHYDYHIAGHR